MPKPEHSLRESDAYWAARYGGRGLQDITFCRYPSDTKESSSGKSSYPQINFDPNDKSLPCNAVVTNTNGPSSSGNQVPLLACLTQRRLGLCPRGFGPEVPKELLSGNQKP